MPWPQDIPTTIATAVATVLCLVAMVAAVRRFRRVTGGRRSVVERVCILAATLVCAAAFGYRAFYVQQSWALLESHVDGLLALGALLGCMIMYLQWSGRLAGVDLFAQPTLAVLLAWSICASWWTFRPFSVASLWNTVHLISVYLVVAGIVVTAASGAMYLYIQRQLKRRDDPADSIRVLGRFASLETTERSLEHGALGSFILLSIALVSGIVVTASQAYASSWLFTPKIGLSIALWVVLGIVVHVRLVPALRGRRAAWLSLLGLALLLAALAIAASIPGCAPAPSEPGIKTVDEPVGYEAEVRDPMWQVENRR